MTMSISAIFRIFLENMTRNYAAEHNMSRVYFRNYWEQKHFRTQVHGLPMASTTGHGTDPLHLGWICAVLPIS